MAIPFFRQDHDANCKALQTLMTYDCDCIYDKGICNSCQASIIEQHYDDCEHKRSYHG